MKIGMKNIGETIESCVEHAYGTFDVDKSDIQIFSWPQLWSSTSCGFGGIGGCAMTWAQTTVILDLDIKTYYVYHSSRYAYAVSSPSEEFLADFDKRQLVGKARYKNQYEKAEESVQLAM